MSEPPHQCTRCKQPHNNLKYKFCDSCRLKSNAQYAKKSQSYTPCQATGQQGKPCGRQTVNNTCYCDTHYFMLDYTPEQLQGIRQCSSCHNYKYWDAVNKVCPDCTDRLQNIRHSVNVSSSALMCKAMVAQTKTPGKMCDKRASANGYCGKHQRVFRESQLVGSQRMCANSIRGCVNILDASDSYSKCEECRDKARLKDNERKAVADASIAQFNATQQATATTSLDIMLMCKECKKEAPASTFITSKGAHSQKCGDCLDKQRAKESTRDRTGRDYKTYEAKPERKEKKKEWNLLNPEKQTEYYKRHREIQKDILGMDEYRKKQAELAVIYRAGHPEVMRRIYAKERANVDRKLSDLKRTAAKNGIPMLLTDQEGLSLMAGHCFYCGDLPDTSSYYHAVSRKDSSLGYSVANAITACKMCSAMRASRWTPTEFVLVADHILSFHKFIVGQLHPELFKNHLSQNYTATKHDAEDNAKTFKLSLAEFTALKQDPCYLCGKMSSSSHANGIDRVNNDGCYVLYNCKACCGSCNYLKKNWTVKQVFAHLVHIHNHNSAYPIPLEKCDSAFATVSDTLDVILHDDDIIDTKKCRTGMASAAYTQSSRFSPSMSVALQTADDNVPVGSTIVEDTLAQDVSNVMITSDDPIAALNSRLREIKSIPLKSRNDSLKAEYEKVRRQLHRYSTAVVVPVPKAIYVPPPSHSMTDLERAERANLSKRLYDERKRAELGDAEFNRRAAERTAKSRRNN